LPSDSVVDHFPSSCAACGAAVTPAMSSGRHSARQVFDLPEPRPLGVTEHRAHDRRRPPSSAIPQTGRPSQIRYQG
jgi:hypothetical protein